MESRILTVNGTGKVSIKPDYTIISVSLDTKDKAYEKAVEKASVQIELLKTSLINIGFQKNDLKTFWFSDRFLCGKHIQLSGLKLSLSDTILLYTPASLESFMK